MRKKENHSIGSVGELTEAQKIIITALADWKHATFKSSSYNIAKVTKLSASHVCVSLRVLKDREIVLKNKGGTYYLNPKLLPEIKAEIEDEKDGNTGKDEPGDQGTVQAEGSPGSGENGIA